MIVPCVETGPLAKSLAHVLCLPVTNGGEKSVLRFPQAASALFCPDPCINSAEIAYNPP